MANKSFPKTVSFSTAVLFDQPMTYMPEHTIAGALTFTVAAPVDPDGDQPGYGTMVRLVADGTNTPDFSNFVTIGTGSWNNTAGAVNRVVFMFDGEDYCVSFLGSGSGSGGGTLATPNVTIDNITSTGFRMNWSAITNADEYYWEVASDAGFTSIGDSGTTASLNATFNLGVASTTYYWRVRAQDSTAVYGNSAYDSGSQATSSGGSIDPDAQDIIDAINLTAAGPLSGTDETDIDDLVVALKAAGTWTLRDAIYVPVWAVAAANAINWKAPSGAGLNWQGSPTHGASGVLGAGIMPVNLNTLANVSQNSISIGYYIQSAPVPGALESYGGVQDATNTAALYYYAGPGGNVGGGVNNPEGIVTALSPAAGYELINRVNSGGFAIIRAGVNAHSETVASTGVPTGEKVRFGAMGSAGGGQLYAGSAIWSLGLVGAGLTVTQYEDEYDAIQAFMVARGIDV